MARPDPIYAAIKTYRAACDRLATADDQVTHCRALNKFCATMPTTLAGAIAALRFVERSEAQGDLVLSGSPDRGRQFIATWRKALERYARPARHASIHNKKLSGIPPSRCMHSPAGELNHEREPHRKDNSNRRRLRRGPAPSRRRFREHLKS